MSSAPTLASVRDGGGCANCCVYGFSRTAPALIYLITHKAHGAHKIGVTSTETRQSRLRAHIRHGWKIYRTRRLPTGAAARSVEVAVLAQLRDDGLAPYLSASQMPQRGHNETVDAQEITLPELWHRILATIDSQRGERPQ